VLPYALRLTSYSFVASITVFWHRLLAAETKSYRAAGEAEGLDGGVGGEGVALHSSAESLGRHGFNGLLAAPACSPARSGQAGGIDEQVSFDLAYDRTADTPAFAAERVRREVLGLLAQARGSAVTN
jgi:hypothetical protein